MKKTALAGVLILACLAVSCDLFFSDNAGEDGNVSFFTGEGGGSVSGNGGSGVSDILPGNYPSLGDPRILVYDAAGRVLRSYAFTGDTSSREFSVPAGGPYWVDFSAPVQHPADTMADPFPFVLSFGATVRLDAVERGSHRELFFPLRVRETALVAPYMPGRTDVFVPFHDFPAEYPAGVPAAFVDRNGIDDPCLDFDPYGRLLTTARRGTTMLSVSGVLKTESFNSNNSGHEQFISSFFTTTAALAFNLRDGNLYCTSVVSGGYNVDPVSSGSFWDSLGDALSSLFSSGDLTSPLIATDEEGAFYVIKNDSIIRATATGTVSFSIADVVGPGGQGHDPTVSVWSVLDLKALNGHLYMLLRCGVSSSVYYYFAALPLGAIKKENVRGAAWFAGGGSPAELSGSGSLEGFFEPKMFTGWGPDRIYIYDRADGFHRTLEVDLRGRRISRAGLVLSR